MPVEQSDERDVRIVATADLLRETLARLGQVHSTSNSGARRLGGQPFGEAVEQVALATVVNPHLPIAWPHWPPGLIPKAQAALQKLTRRLLAWYINPIVAQQNAFNHAVLSALQDAYRANDQLGGRLTAVERERDTLRDQLALIERAVLAAAPSTEPSPEDPDRRPDRPPAVAGSQRDAAVSFQR